LAESAHPISAAARRWMLADGFMIPNLPKSSRLLESYTRKLSHVKITLNLSATGRSMRRVTSGRPCIQSNEAIRPHRRQNCAVSLILRWCATYII
jgi:hypothetical protein